MPEVDVSAITIKCGMCDAFSIYFLTCLLASQLIRTNTVFILWVRCTINRSHSTPCKKAEFEHLQIFPGHCLDFFSVCEWQDLLFTYQKSEKTTYLDNLVFSAFSVLWGTVKKSGLKSDPRQTLPGECAGESVTK